jgi:hypothetical protein
MATERRKCCVDGCDRPWFCRDRCQFHYGKFQQLSAAERATELERPSVPFRPRWRYENPQGEQELIEQLERTGSREAN